MKFGCNFFDLEKSNKKERQAAFLACSLARRGGSPFGLPPHF